MKTAADPAMAEQLYHEGNETGKPVVAIDTKEFVFAFPI